MMSTGVYAVPDPTQAVIYNKRRPRDGERGRRGDADNIYMSMRANVAGRHTQGEFDMNVVNHCQGDYCCKVEQIKGVSLLLQCNMDTFSRCRDRIQQVLE